MDESSYGFAEVYTVPVPQDPEKFAQALIELGITPAALREIRTTPFERAQVLLQALKEQAKKAYKRLVLELHPDRTGGDAEKTAKFKLLTEVYRDVEKLQVLPRQPTPQIRPIVLQAPGVRAVPWVQVAGRVATIRTSSVTSAGGTTSAFHVVRMRPT